MTIPGDDKEITVIRYKSGRADEQRLQDLISTAWSEALGNSAERTEIAGLFGVKESDLDPARPPFQAKITGAGLTGAEILIAIASGFVLDFFKDVGGAAGKTAAERLRELWSKHIAKRVSPPGSGELGKPRDEEDGG